jgi:hypothetical protein
MIDFHDAGEDQAIQLWAQAANVGREFQGQHRNCTVGEIDAGTAEAGLLIEGAVASHVMSDVGDVDLELVVVVGKLAN